MLFEFSFNNVKALSLNNMKFIDWRNRRQIKTKECREFRKNIESLLLGHKKQIRKINQEFDSSKHYLKACYRFYYSFITKKKQVSKTAGDWDNFSKPIQDILFDYFDFDDSSIRSASVICINSDTPRIEIDYEIKPINLL